ncbi:MAG TPA: hypothetical protein VGF48_05765 [Thermoanaerobaculia bacterium]|jgi:uncharacterized protein YoxC
MSELWSLFTKNHHPIVVAGLILVFGVFLINAAIHSASFALRILAVAIDELATGVDHVRTNAHQLRDAMRRLRDQVTGKKAGPPPPKHVSSPHQLRP